MTVKMCNLSVSGVVMRYYLMMIIIVAAGFSGLWALALLALPVFISVILGVSFSWGNKSTNTKLVAMPNYQGRRKAS